MGKGSNYNIDIVSTEIAKLFESDEHSLIKSVFITASKKYNLSIEDSVSVMSNYVNSISDRWTQEFNNYKKEKTREIRREQLKQNILNRKRGEGPRSQID